MNTSNEQLRVVVMTSDKPRHNYFVNTLAEELDVVGVVSEAKGTQPGSKEDGESPTLRKHFSAWRDVGERYFGEHRSFSVPDENLLVIERGRASDRDVFEWIRQRNPDYIALYGTTIIRPPLLDYYDGKIVNMHLGLSPYYRGAGTNFWPLVYREPECVGATIHLAVLDVDAGAILAQVRPDATVSDTVHDLGAKTIVKGATQFASILEAYYEGKITPQKQNIGEGRVFRKRDVTAESIERMWKHFETGMMEEYLANKGERDRAFPIVALPS